MEMVEYMQYLAFWTPGPLELIIILIVAVLIFGKRLPEIARGLGKSLTEFKKGIHEGKEIKEDLQKDVSKIKDDIVSEAKDAAGLSDNEQDLGD
jgi:sec-independent protein translocase protein TatA